MNDLPGWQALVLLVLVLSIPVGAILSYLHEKRHPHFKPTPETEAYKDPLAGFPMGCVGTAIVLGTAILTLLGLIKLIKFFWYF